MPDFDAADDPIDSIGEEAAEPDEGPTDAELEAAALPDEREEREAAKAAAKEPPPPDAKDQQIANLNRAMRQEREAKRAAKRQVAELAQRQQRVEQRHEVLMRRVAEATGADISDLLPASEKAPPAADADPIGHLTGKMEQMVAPLVNEIATLKQQLTENQLNGQVAEVDRYVSDDAAAFVADHPDYDEAEGFVLESIAADTWAAAKRQYPTADEDDLAAHVEQYVGRAIGNLKVGAFRDRKSLASIVYSVAQQKGWKPNGEPAAQPGRRQASGKVGELQRNLRRTGANVNVLERAPRKAPLTLSGLADMTDEEFDAATSDPKAWKRLTEAAAG